MFLEHHTKVGGQERKPNEMEENSQTMALSIKGAAELVGISPRHLRRLIANQEGPPLVRLGTRTVIRRQALADWLDKPERDHFLSSSWTVEEDLIRAIGVPLDKNKGRNSARNFILTEAMIAHEIGRSVSYSRRTNFYTTLGAYSSPHYTYANVRPVIEELRGLGLIEELRARPGDHIRTELQSRYWATPELVARWQAKAAAFTLYGLVRLKDSDGNLIPYRDTDETRRMVKEVRGINEYLASHTLDLNAPDAERIGHHIKLDGAYYLPTTTELYRVFNAGSFKLGGRGYWWGQSLSKVRRAGLLLNGEPVAEPDFKQLHPTMLYAERGLTPPNDAYEVDGFTRDEGKIAFNVAVNCQGGKGGTIATLLYKRFESDRRTGLPKWTRSPAETAALVDAIWRKHAPIEGALGTGAGRYLMYLDSRIMLGALKGCERAGIAALPVHDSKIVQTRQESKASEIMEEAFARVFKGSKPCTVRLSGGNVSQIPSSSLSPSSSPVSLPPALSLERAALSGDFELAADALKDPSENLTAHGGGRAVQLDMLARIEAIDPIQEAIAVAAAYEGGIIPEPVIRVIREARRSEGLTQEDQATEFGVSRAQLANAERRRYGLGREPAARLRRWIQERTKAA
jgi:excisionase family DNA binding protein